MPIFHNKIIFWGGSPIRELDVTDLLFGNKAASGRHIMAAYT